MIYGRGVGSVTTLKTFQTWKTDGSSDVDTFIKNQIFGSEFYYGNLVVSPDAIKSLYINTYSDRLGEKEIVDEMKYLREKKELLCKERLKLASDIKSPEVNINKIDKVLKSLKKKKARDPLGLANELFLEGVIGKDLKTSLVHLMNQIKEKKKLPQLSYLANITT